MTRRAPGRPGPERTASPRSIPSSHEGNPKMRTPHGHRARATLAVALLGTGGLGVATLAGCSAVGSLGTPSNSSTSSYSVSGSVDSLEIDASGGDISVDSGGSGGVQVTETYHYNSTTPTTSHNLSGGKLTLQVTTDCRDSVGASQCSVDYNVVVPAGVTATTLNSDGGSISITGLSGNVQTQSNGGTVTGDVLQASQFTANTNGGSISVAFQNSPASVNVSSNGGPTTLKVPNGDYDVSASTFGGPKDIQVGTSSGAQDQIVAHTMGGSLTVEPD